MDKRRRDGEDEEEDVKSEEEGLDSSTQEDTDGPVSKRQKRDEEDDGPSPAQSDEEDGEDGEDDEDGEEEEDEQIERSVRLPLFTERGNLMTPWQLENADKETEETTESVH